VARKPEQQREAIDAVAHNRKMLVERKMVDLSTLDIAHDWKLKVARKPLEAALHARPASCE
jgi:hypothetical protein